MVDPDGSIPLANPAWERFAQALARGGRGTAAMAYRAHVARGPVTDGSAKAAGYAYARKPIIAARIVHLRAAQAAAMDAPAPPLTVGEVASILAEVTAVLDETHTTASARGADPRALVRLRRVLSGHTGRLGYRGSVAPDPVPPSVPGQALGGLAGLPPVPVLVPCSCAPTAPVETS